MRSQLFLRRPQALLYFFLFASVSVLGQQNLGDIAHDSLKIDGVPSYPLLKILSVSYDYAGKSDYKMRYKGAPDEEGEFTRGRTQVYLWIPFYKSKRFTWSVSETYTREDIVTRDVVNPSGIYVNGNQTLEDFNTALNVNYRTKLFSRQLVLNASFFAGTSPAFKFRKASGQVYALLILKDTPNTIYSVGVAGLIDPSSPIPALPIAQYWHRFDNSLWEADVVVPQTAKIRRSRTLGGWVSAGVDFTPQSFFIRNVPGQDVTYEAAFSELTPNLGYDKMLYNNIMLTVQGGYRFAMKGRLVEVNEPSRDRIAHVEFGSGLFVKGGISYVIPNAKVRKTIDDAR
ncbi:hypothetical protein [Flavobacterium selenitireducens]|uniref:hypothetical protein n=1 Tax=Flavobacterium selenitireducens TaxID=2722704 RepID=UPI00168A9D74|nr:hypothetical protein [Flavobacterium selenitireducens]MBD3583962.1 hypothetical protein [Flavobacterium selenitireducens]